jgi:hypothetical protein
MAYSKLQARPSIVRGIEAVTYVSKILGSPVVAGDVRQQKEAQNADVTCMSRPADETSQQHMDGLHGRTAEPINRVESKLA